MSPVKQSTPRDARALVFAVGGLVLGIALVLGVFVFAIPQLSEEGRIEVRLGEDDFEVGSAEAKAATIADGGPLLFSDVAGGDRDIFVQHLGDDPNTGWYAFDARRAGTGRDCTLRWEPDAQEFVDPCDDSRVGADGGDLRHYTVVVTEEGRVIVTLREEADPGTTQPAPSTTEADDDLVTGTVP
jgi:hypothetical protein